ncbi:MAG: hypothetical protein J6I53_03770 [Treponema sp.]|nr:hypothetical protein [Treponema sp.]
MKKIFFTFLLFVSIFSAEAASDYYAKNFCLGISFPFINNDYLLEDVDSVKLNAVGLNLNYRSMKDTMKIGVFLDADIYMPYTKTLIIDEDTQASTKISDYDYFFGTDVLAGIYAVLYNDSSLSIPFGGGLHIDGYISKQKYETTVVKESVYTLGIGAWVNLEVDVSQKFGVYFGSKLVYDFYYKLNNKAMPNTIQDGKCKGFTFAPALGIVWHL